MSAAATTKTAPNAAGAGAPAGAAVDPYVVLVFHTILVLLALVALVVFLRLPRAFARLWHRSEWKRGHFLGYEPYTGPGVFPFAGLVVPSDIDLSKTVGSSQDSHAPILRREAAGRYPPHVRPTPPFLRPVVSLLRSRVAPGLTGTQMAVCAGWLGIILYPAIYGSRGPFTDINRYGLISISQVPFIFALGSKNNILGMLLGMGYEKLNFLHRFVARLAIITAHLHGLGYIYKWCIANTFMQEISQQKNYFGLCMLLSFDCILLSSLAFIRKNAYNFFLYSHVIFTNVLLICAFYHYPQVMPYVVATAFIFGINKLLQIAKTRVKMATIRPIPQLGMTRIEIPNLNKGWRAGQHVRIQVFSFAMGRMGWAQVHPFTIASESNSKEGLVLMCKKTGTWTQKLFAAAATTKRSGAFSAAMFIVGGSGITFALSAIQELIQQDSRGESRVRVIGSTHLDCARAESLMPLLPQFSSLIQQSAGARLTISRYCTWDIADPRTSALDGCDRRDHLAHREYWRQRRRALGLIVSVCGPVSLADDVVKAVSQVDPAKENEIGGIEVHEEQVTLPV
ncbi:hypothetical protein K438DRAFT_1965667 [Mycena galopus ATCC 62051]|nr:hypothetical protein K438DRAFT_1965667 [Mycena galopus ATCC 62051]